MPGGGEPVDVGGVTEQPGREFVTGAAGWRTIFALAAVVAVLLAVLLYRATPPLAPRARVPYPALIASVGAVLMRERAARWTLVAAFTLVWTALTFLLSGPPFRYPIAVIGLFGLTGLAGALAVQHAGRLLCNSCEKRP